MDPQNAPEGAAPDALLAQGWRQRDLPGFAGLVGPLWTRRDDAGWAYGLLTTASHTNPAGVVHGGLLATLIDHALSAIAWEAAGRRPCVTVQLDTHFLASARVGQFLVARGTVLRASSSLVFVQGSITSDGAALVAATVVMKIVGPAS
jgi:uncharacterized protein (TIGR00369 family)